MTKRQLERAIKWFEIDLEITKDRTIKHHTRTAVAAMKRLLAFYGKDDAADKG